MRLHIGVIGPEQLAGAFDGQRFGPVHIFAATVIAFTGITLGVLVGHLGALGGHNQRTGVVFRGDQLDMFLLAAVFLHNCRPDFRIKGFESQRFVKHGLPLAVVEVSVVL